MNKLSKPISKGMVLFTVILMDLLAGMEFDLFVPSFPELQSHFSLSPFLVESLLSVNFIGYCLSLFLVGGLADRYGRKPIILVGVMTFVVGSIFCLWATAYPALLVWRFLQGIGVAAPSILSFLIIADNYPLKQQQFFWQGNFKVLLLLGGLVLIMTMLFIPTNKLSEQKETNLPLGYISLFKSKSLVLLMAQIVFMSVPYWIFVGMSPLLYMQGLGVSLSHFGYYQGVLALIFALGSIVLGLVIRRFNQKPILFVSFLIFIVSLISIGSVILLDSHSPLLITLAFIPFIIGQISSSILYLLCLNFMPKAKGRVAAVIQGGRLIFCALCLQIAGFYYRGSFQNIGMIISGFILLGVITLFLVMRNETLMKGHQE